MSQNEIKCELGKCELGMLPLTSLEQIIQAIFFGLGYLMYGCNKQTKGSAGREMEAKPVANWH